MTYILTKINDNRPKAMTIKGYELVLTNADCPEQYDVFKDGEQVAYFRLRHGFFSAECPEACEELVYEAKTKGSGAFDDDDEREKCISEAIDAVDRWLMKEQNKLMEES